MNSPSYIYTTVELMIYDPSLVSSVAEVIE